MSFYEECKELVLSSLRVSRRTYVVGTEFLLRYYLVCASLTSQTRSARLSDSLVSLALHGRAVSPGAEISIVSVAGELGWN
jgi:hypothetical protein